MAARTPKKRRSSKKSPSLPFGRKFKLAGVSAAAVFAVVSFVLNPNLREFSKVERAVAELIQSIQNPGSELLAPTGEYVQTQFQSCPHFFPQQQPPIVPSQNRLREMCFDSFAILHNGQTKTPVFVAQRLNKRMLEQAKAVPRSNRFYEEARLPSADRATLADYRNSGYSRGHMAPAGDMDTPEAMAQSFSLSNMVPQNQTHNAGAWSKVEGDTRQYVRRAKGDVYVVTGPVYGQRTSYIGENRVAVPEYIYKLVYDPSDHRAWVYWHKNDPKTVVGNPISYEEFVKRTGLQILPTMH